MEEITRRVSLEGLLFDLYEGWHPRHYSFETESWTDNSVFSDVANGKFSTYYRKHYSLETLKQLNVCELGLVLGELQREINEASQRLVRQLKRRDHQLSRNQAKCNIVTAVLQALSPKRSNHFVLLFASHSTEKLIKYNGISSNEFLSLIEGII